MRRRGELLMLAVALGALGALAGCNGTPSADPPPALPPAPSPIPSVVPDGPTQGLDIRYLGPDGTTRTLKVKDFPR